MAPKTKTVKKVIAKAPSTDMDSTEPPLNDDGSGNLSDPDLHFKVNLQMILAEKEKCLAEKEKRG